jgi:hypothetical protein
MLPFVSGLTRSEQKEHQSLVPCVHRQSSFLWSLGLEDEFNVSIGWLTRFRQWYSICEIAVQGERLTASDAAANRFHIEFQKFVQEENLEPHQIHNAVEYASYWKDLPTRPFVFEKEKCVPRHNFLKSALWSCVVELHLEVTNWN